MAHNSRRKEIIFMEKIRWIRGCAVLVMTVAVMTACGRKNGNNMTTSPGTGSAGVGSTVESQTNGTNQSRSEEHTSELQSRQYLVCRLLLEKIQL